MGNDPERGLNSRLSDAAVCYRAAVRPFFGNWPNAAVAIGSNHLQNVTSSHIFCVRSNFFIQNRYSMKTYYSLLSDALVTLNNVVNVN